MHFDRLADTLGVKENREAYLYLLDQVSEMQRPIRKSKNRVVPPLLMTAAPLHLDDRPIYPIYRQDQEDGMIKEKRLSDEIVVDLRSVLGSFTLSDLILVFKHP